MFVFATPRARRRPSLTPMVDVVFLLLVFFMLAARFGAEMALPLGGGGAGAAEWDGPPRLVEFGPDYVRLNGIEIEADALPEALGALMPTPQAAIVLLPDGTADVQRLTTLSTLLTDAGFGRLVVMRAASEGGVDAPLP